MSTMMPTNAPPMNPTPMLGTPSVSTQAQAPMMMGGRKSRKVTRKNQRAGANMNMGDVPSSVLEMKGGAKVGTRAQVFHGTADHTSGGLTKKDLFMNKRGRIVSKKASAAGKKAFKRLTAAGYKPKKGVFKLFTKKAARRGGFF